MIRASRWIAPCAFTLFSLAAALPAGAQTGAKNGEWQTYGGDLASTRYAALDQINADNFNKLAIAWRFKTDSLGPRPEFKFESTPLMVHGVLYSTGGTRRAVFALDAATGELLWMHSENEGERATNAPRQLSGHGVAYWTDGKEERILYVTPGYRLIALDAKTGIRVHSFGVDGVVDLKKDDDQNIDLITGEVGLHSTPVVARNLVIVGAAHLTGGVPHSRKNVKGYVRAFDVRTGKRIWIFHTIPLPNEFGNETWLKESWAYTGNTGVWGQISVDENLGLVYLPVELPTGDYFGGDRPGNGLFGESLVALDLETGKRKWHFQLVHHGLWDMDIPCAPILTDITINGRTVKAVAQPTKQAYLYVFNRENGQPIWPMPETPVPQGDVPGEWYSPTQPIPSKPPAFDNQGISSDSLINFTPALHAEAEDLVSKYRIGPLFTPPSVSKAGGPLATIVSPGALGGANWPGGSYDPETHTVYVYSRSDISALGLVPSPNAKISDMEYVQGTAGFEPHAGRPMGAPPLPAANPESGEPVLLVRGLPLLKPPYGRITAINLDKGEIVWQVAHGQTPDNVRNSPALAGLNIPRTGSTGLIGVLTTKSLVIAGEAINVTLPSGTRGAMLRAYDKATGKDAGAVYMPAPQSGSPMTYMLNGQQYVVVAVSGPGYPGELIAYRLPATN
ncbi:MAG TPA: pyrroloquinoline quinone-dependent dehydrogenase [Candidatus Acidoferrales bacterium]|nr:pyrroloquinoline quinone-dependent dehydrogenase [Candidatus Acidoferrales bacterium]